MLEIRPLTVPVVRDSVPRLSTPFARRFPSPHRQERTSVKLSLRSTVRGAIGAIAAAGLVAAGYAATPAQAAPPTDGPGSGQAKGLDNLRPPQAVKQDALRQRALEQRLAGKPEAQGKVAELSKGHYVELEREGEDRIFVVLVEFGDQRYPDARFADATTTPDPIRCGSTARCTTRSPSRTGPWTTPRCGRRTTTGRTTTTCTSRGWRPTTSVSRRVATRSTVTSPSGSRCRSTRHSTAATTAAASSATPARHSCATPWPCGSTRS